MSDDALAAGLRERIRDVPDFPQPGIVFKDITPLLADAGALGRVAGGLAERARPHGADLDLAPHAADALVSYEVP